MFDFKYPSQYFVEVLFVIGIVSLIVMIISGVILKVRNKPDEDISKGGVGKILKFSLIVFLISVLYVVTFKINSKIFVLFGIVVLRIIQKVKPKWGAFKQIFITLLIFALFMVPVVGVLHCDNIVRDEQRRKEEEAANKVAQELAYTEADNGLSFDKVVKASGYSYVQWSGRYNNNGDFKIVACCKKNKYAPYDETLEFHFVYSPLTDDLELDYIDDNGDDTTYSKEKSEQIFDELIEKALNNEK